MSAALPPTVNMQLLLASKSKGRVVKGRCGVEPASLLGEMENLLLQKVVTPLQYASATYTYTYS